MIFDRVVRFRAPRLNTGRGFTPAPFAFFRPHLKNAALRHPMRFSLGRENPSIVHLNRMIDHPNIQIGDYTYANDFDPPADPSGLTARRAGPRPFTPLSSLQPRLYATFPQAV